MSTKFFTNSTENTLIKKFEGIFTHTQVAFFDALVGFFRSSGYFRVRGFLQKVTKIRILVGIDVDHLMTEASLKGLEFKFNANETREEFYRRLVEDIQEANYDKEVEEGILEFIRDVGSGRIEIKAHPDKNIHAKIYIFRPANWNEHNSGSVISGSSNLTESGLERNFEFNVELRDFDDVAFSLKTFEALWDESIDISPQIIQKAKLETYINDEFSPFEIYVKFLIEYFGSSIEYDPESITDLPKGYKKLAYQVDAVNDGYNKLLKHGGFFLSDVVGLGKTVIATIIAKKFYFSNGYRTKTLIVHPPALEPSWQKTLRDFEFPNWELITNGSLHKIKHPEDYDLILIDEAHKFRSDESEMFNQLQKLCKTPCKRKQLDGTFKKKVILITATPLNNRPEDIRNQIYLFQDAKRSTLEVGNLQHFFRPHIDTYEKLRKERDRTVIAREVKKIYEDIRVKILTPIIVRRTRTDIENTPQYWEDLSSQGERFPKIIPPRQVLYVLKPDLNVLYDKTIQLLKGNRNGLGYYRYQAIKFLPKEVKDKYFNKRADVISEQLANIMRILLVKRIDSSFYAFKKSLKRFRDANTAMLKMIEKGRIYIAPKLNVNEFILNDKEDDLEEILRESSDPELIQAFAVEDFDKEFVDGIFRDESILNELVSEWGKVTQDPKYDKLRDQIDNFLDSGINDNHKLIIFSESKETTEYITERLNEDGFSKLLSVSSGNQKDLAETIAKNFDANYNPALRENNYDIIITTEVLAEGVNLHRSNVVVNYDIPWNATRLMQRIGRVNRVGTPSEYIYIYNFFPTAETDDQIELNKKAYIKLQAFHSALGEDSQIYSTEEEFNSYGLFEKVPEEEKDERLEFLNWLRQFRDQNPDEFRRIQKKIPKRARCGRKDVRSKQCTLAYLKNRHRDSFFFVFPDFKLEELTFIEAARIYKSTVSERAFPLHGHHHEQIQIALNEFESESSLRNLGDKATVKLGPNEQKAVALLGNFRGYELATPDEEDLMFNARNAIRKGAFQKLPREINKLIKSAQAQRLRKSELYESLITVLSDYPLAEIAKDNDEEDHQMIKRKTKLLAKNDLPEIIISESFTG
ncbi:MULTISPECIES: helicase-related protein [unclassified Imperialibacter]|uniref:helicase-related protein n=1 Tax=unclassified Imperialibacter TaxID=2629706 RepID=UPI00125820C7|nr:MULTISPECIES: helicase-related protein [unclassified Imperialibacter]CAD5257342.1 Phospholipase D-like protein [Imperialibacter sp. 89]CAD5272335.1 Phospholipase D-like protein [Imperialibacter sp. 75]VVT32102.1 Helicase domain protein [Imperialibacter sp. EC-SDR9]